ncbi:DUF3747 domain-containing protein [Lyngbya confervoides]|uniref:DUF3747 domain-containing protein n=1 Tax=Lyngbya confervoides BDU141951 TaxID=1574623 RepID=A0ABD4SZ77_9CYAN|nr:DUF3747 domain-containing protein [Lyngbya confervoides]MCM1981584.1 DUF3747 domain-containing protein [Lyngbya confervoides BDU141951]
MSRPKRLLLGITLALSSLPVSPAIPSTSASPFGEKAVDQTRFIAVAAPIGDGSSHQLLILEQVSNQRACWREQGVNPTLVEPLLTQFNFAGICGRSLDANGYSIRIAGQELGLSYRLRIRRQEGNLLLVGVPDSPRYSELLLGSTRGETNSFAKIFLNSGWEFTKRTFGYQTLGHIYLSNPALSTVSALPRDFQASSRVISDTPHLSEGRLSVSSQTSRQFGAAVPPGPDQGSLRPSNLAYQPPLRRGNIPYGNPTRGQTIISSLFGKRPNPFGSGTVFHKGMDLSGPNGTPIISTGAGRVVKSKKAGAYGNHVMIDHGNGFRTLYAHLSNRAVQENQAVRRGQIIGSLGSSGRTTGPHLHYEIHHKGEAIDPKPYVLD